MSKKGKQKQIRLGTQPYCVYCQKEVGTTDDEVIAKSLFGDNPPVKEGYIVVPACVNCNNNIKSKDDVSLREITVFDNEARNHPTAKFIFNNVILPSIRTNERKPTPVQLNVAFNNEVVTGVTKSGIYVGDYHLIKLDQNRVNAIFFRLSQGLYYYFTKKYLSPNVNFTVKRISIEEAELFKAVFNEYGVTGLYSTESNIFNCAFVRFNNIPGYSFSILQFYGGIYYTLVTKPKGYKEDDPNLSDSKNAKL